MNNQNFLEKLLDGVAVEWKPLGKTLTRTKGTNITAGQMKELHKDNAPLKIDWPLRPGFNWREQQEKSGHRDLAAAIARLAFLRRGSPALCRGDYRQLSINHEQISFLRQTGEERIVVMVNASDKAVPFNVEVPFDMGAEAYDLLNEQSIAVGKRQIACEVFPNWARVLRV